MPSFVLHAPSASQVLMVYRVWWRAVACGGVRWRAVACGGVRWRAVACGGVRWCAVVPRGKSILSCIHSPPSLTHTHLLNPHQPSRCAVKVDGYVQAVCVHDLHCKIEGQDEISDKKTRRPNL